ncbi:MAG: tRNA preQ1(34) S-adenosylmethionine ribosyltransferase-isomerase QueA [Nitrospinae bacterium]|nr:tRNA preQ1(34) S-adenosylmethionine ribosyltransferase-isomerase QueA [Nitrospinota bacterium]
MKLSDFDFPLPEELIAQRPAPHRDQSRLMAVDRDSGRISHAIFSDIGAYLTGRPLLVFNNTRVVPAKLHGYKKSNGKRVEVLLVRELEPARWETMIKGLSRIKTGDEIVFGDEELVARLEETHAGRGYLRFFCSGDLTPTLNRLGRPPLPPYIRRSPHDGQDLLDLDRERYQTVFAERPGSIAAPTSGLHFTKDLLEDIRTRRADLVSLTLHVGVGTFQPVREEEIVRHKMEKEYYHIPANSWNRILKAKIEGQKILAVGTTATRVLESAEIAEPAKEDVAGWTDRFIYPGQEFKNVRGLVTNFHLPKSTLYLLVCAFAGKDLMEKAYNEAIRQKYRFFSYGDAMLIL